MKIIQHGRISSYFSPVKRFKCNTCGCVFEADRGEYVTGSQYNEPYCYCQCPDCGRQANSVTIR